MAIVNSTTLPRYQVTADNAKAHKYRDENKFGFDAVAQLASDDVGTKVTIVNAPGPQCSF